MIPTTLAGLEERLRRLEAECDGLRGLIQTIKLGAQDDRDPTIAVTDRIIGFMRRFPEVTFAPLWLMAAVDAPEESVRKSLTRLKARGLVENPRYGRWRLAS